MRINTIQFLFYLKECTNSNHLFDLRKTLYKLQNYYHVDIYIEIFIMAEAFANEKWGALESLKTVISSPMLNNTMLYFAQNTDYQG